MVDCCVAHLDYNWNKFKAAKVKYGSKIKVTDHGYLGAVLVSSETDEFTISDIIKEFEIELLDEHMERVLAHRHNPRNIEL
ncbi:MAG: hypothetical protein ABFD25_20265 [Clostridiaceae bacterium]